MSTPTLKQARMEPKNTGTIKLSLDGQKRFAELSKNPPAPTTPMEKLKVLPDFAVRTL